MKKDTCKGFHLIKLNSKDKKAYLQLGTSVTLVQVESVFIVVTFKLSLKSPQI